ncbi:MAG: hypothetical protein ABEH38_07810 [Flavobacteriales bacterium]
MELLTEILKISIPAVVVALTIYFVLQNMLDQWERERKREQQQWEESQKHWNKQLKQILETVDEGKGKSYDATPVRLQAYERLLLLLERIGVNNLVMRVYQDGESAKKLRDDLQRSIREEFDHNLTQQLYVSEEAWDLISKAKEEMVKFINTEAEKLEDDATALDLSKALFDRASQVDTMPTSAAAAYLKKEAHQLFG